MVYVCQKTIILVFERRFHQLQNFKLTVYFFPFSTLKCCSIVFRLALFPTRDPLSFLSWFLFVQLYYFSLAALLGRCLRCTLVYFMVWGGEETSWGVIIPLGSIPLMFLSILSFMSFLNLLLLIDFSSYGFYFSTSFYAQQFFIECWCGFPLRCRYFCISTIFLSFILRCS